MTPPASRRLRVLRVVSRLDTGGIEMRLLDLLPRLDRERFEVRVVSIRRAGTVATLLEQRGVPVTVVRCHGQLATLWSAWKLARFMRGYRPDIVHGHTLVPSLYAARAGRIAGVPVRIASFHNVGEAFTPAQIRAERRWAPERDATVHVSRAVHDDYLRVFAPAVDSGRVIYNGVRVERFRTPPPPERLAQLRDELGLSGRAPVLMTVARIHAQKGPEDLLEAFARVRAAQPRAALAWVGDGPAAPALRERAAALGIAGDLVVTGMRDDVRDLYHLATLHVMASHREGFSNVLLEAMAAGLPQVVTDVGGNREALGESGAGILLPPRRPELLGEALVEVLADPARLAAMAAAARARSEAFSADEQLRRTEALYLELARARGLIGGAEPGGPGPGAEAGA
jgi:glycosyltransferase involved in cell wall biosynthesis